MNQHGSSETLNHVPGLCGILHKLSINRTTCLIKHRRSELKENGAALREVFSTVANSQIVGREMELSPSPADIYILWIRIGTPVFNSSFENDILLF
ncbi:hypothetical protein CEXT_505551 [Caerostris extrusa]|uniref:Uncharacterized protein n=1 Tax=Caerostris extrusa TaxID=172846 RepID=A0AAV4NJN1_CAEEX|nr:hypothetical protein CEXT_505551 [Caerostris extrusa]